MKNDSLITELQVASVDFLEEVLAATDKLRKKLNEAIPGTPEEKGIHDNVSKACEKYHRSATTGLHIFKAILAASGHT